MSAKVRKQTTVRGRRSSTPRPGATGTSSPRGRARSARRASALLAAAALAGCSLSPSGEGATGTGRAALISTERPSSFIRFADRDDEIRFETTTCSADPERFAAVGSGKDGETDFLVRVRAKHTVEIRYGTDDEMDADTDGTRQLVPSRDLDVRLAAVPRMNWIRGTALLVDTSVPESKPVRAEILIRCQ